jgi:hypothetical protein
MLERILKLYVMAMAGDVRSPMPHLFGPPGCGKSTAVEHAAEIIGCQLHIINVSRISPLELEGVQMPMDMDGANPRLHLLTATFWTQLREGDIILLDEFLRAFPEVYNGLLDILTSRQVGGFKLPKVFIIGASNSTVAYDKALEDRLLHIPAADPRSSKVAKKEQAELLTGALGLLPEMANSMEMVSLLDTEVLPMYELLDQLKGKGSTAVVLKGSSVRNLIGQAKLRDVSSTGLKELLSMNNSRAISQGKWQYLFLYDRKNPEMNSNTETQLKKIKGNARLTEIQSLNVELNLQLIELENQRKEKEIDDDDIIGDPPF